MEYMLSVKSLAPHMSRELAYDPKVGAQVFSKPTGRDLGVNSPTISVLGWVMKRIGRTFTHISSVLDGIA